MKKTAWIARTAICLALLLCLQFVTKSLGQFVTGSCVNLVIAMAALIGGLWSGLTVAIVSPFCAYLLGIGPAFVALVPCVALGNAVYALIFGLLVRAFLLKKKAVAAIISMAARRSAEVPGPLYRACEARGPERRAAGKVRHGDGGVHMAAADHGADRRRAGAVGRAAGDESPRREKILKIQQKSKNNP